MYMAVASSPPPSSTTTAALAGLSGYVPDSTRKRLMTFYPPPYGFASGMGACCSSCTSGGPCEGGDHGMGQLFDSGTDISGWGWPEWAIVGFGAFAVLSAVQNVTSAGRSVSRSVRRYRRRRAQ